MDTTKTVRKAMKTFARIDILVNNAGIALVGSLIETTPEEWDRTIKVYLYGTSRCNKEVVPHMVAQGYGRIVNLSSFSGLAGFVGRAAYGAVKGGIGMLTKVLSVELAPWGIRVNAIAPGPVETELSRAAWTWADCQGYFRLTPKDGKSQVAVIEEDLFFVPQMVLTVPVYIALRTNQNGAIVKDLAICLVDAGRDVQIRFFGFLLEEWI